MFLDRTRASASRPKAWALTASLRQSSSESLRRLPRSPARSTRFSLLQVVDHILLLAVDPASHNEQ